METEPVKISIQMLTGTSFPLHVILEDSVEAVKVQIEHERGFPREQQDLVQNVTKLEDDFSLAEYNIQAGSLLSLLVRPPQHVAAMVMAAASKINFEPMSITFLRRTADEQQDALRKVGTLLAQHPYLNLLIEGHATPGFGPNALPLSQARADRCAAGILGVAPGRVHARGLGYNFPAVEGEDVPGNRRVEFYLLTPDRNTYPPRADCLAGPLPAVEDELFPPRDTNITMITRSAADLMGLYKVIKNVNMTQEESLDSDCVALLDVGKALNVFELGQGYRVHANYNGTEGWVSLTDQNGEQVLRKIDGCTLWQTGQGNEDDDESQMSLSDIGEFNDFTESE